MAKRCDFVNYKIDFIHSLKLRYADLVTIVIDIKYTIITIQSLLSFKIDICYL